MTSDLVNGSLPFDCFQGNLDFEFRGVSFSLLFSHRGLQDRQQYYTLIGCLYFGDHHINDPPHKIKLLVTNLPEASTSEILSHFSRRWMVEGNQRWIEREGKRLTPCWSRRSNLNPAIAQTRFRGCARATRNCAGGIWYLTRGRGEIGSAIDIRHGRRRAGLLT
jgi:hypothetical protein